MNRTVDIAEWRASRPSSARLMAEVAEGEHRQRAKPRDPDEAVLLVRSAVAAAARREEEGRLVRWGPRNYELRVQ